MKRPLGPVLGCLAAAALFGAATPAAKWLLSGFGPLTLAGLFYLGAALAVLPVAGGGGAAPRQRRRQAPHLAGAVVLGGVAGPLLLLTGLEWIPASTASLGLNLEMPATVVLAFAFFHEHLDRRTLAGAVLVLAAGMILALPVASLSPGVGSVSAGLSLVALACLAWGLDNNLTAIIDGYTPAQITLVKGLVAGSVDLALGLALEHPALSPRTVAVPLAVGALGYGLSLVLYVRGAQRLGAARSQMIFAAAPFIGTAGAWLVLGERVVASEIVAAAAMATGVAVMLTGHHAHEHAHDATTHTHAHRHDDGHHDHVHPGLPAWVEHTHAHTHQARVHSHPHEPDLHHRHSH